jgi:hypothetical protein
MQKVAGVYTVPFFEISVYIKRYKNRGRGKEKSNLNVSTFTLLAQNNIILKTHPI